jgi:hypothetical protein
MTEKLPQLNIVRYVTNVIRSKAIKCNAEDDGESDGDKTEKPGRITAVQSLNESF